MRSLQVGLRNCYSLISFGSMVVRTWLHAAPAGRKRRFRIRMLNWIKSTGGGGSPAGLKSTGTKLLALASTAEQSRIPLAHVHNDSACCSLFAARRHGLRVDDLSR